MMKTCSELVGALQCSRLPTAVELYRLIQDGEALPVTTSPGRGRAVEYYAMYNARLTAAERNGYRTSGYQDTLEALSMFDAQAYVLLCAFRSSDRRFVVFVDDSSGQVIGCVSSSNAAIPA